MRQRRSVASLALGRGFWEWPAETSRSGIGVASPSRARRSSPGRESEGYLHMPGGQSGHPLSPFYRAGHEAWVRGEATAFLPGTAKYTLKLVPAGS